MPVRTKAWEDALAFQSGWKRLGTSPRSARAGTEEASTADSVSRKSILLYYMPKQTCASVVNRIIGLLLNKNGPPRPFRVLRGGSLNSHLHAILAFREWPGDWQFHLCRWGLVSVCLWGDRHLSAAFSQSISGSYPLEPAASQCAADLVSHGAIWTRFTPSSCALTGSPRTAWLIWGKEEVKHKSSANHCSF